MADSFPDSSDDPELSNSQLMRRLLALVWKYRAGCIWVLSLQVVLITIGLYGLAFTGLGIDFIHHELDPTSKAPDWPFGLHPPLEWPPLAIVGVIAAAILGMAILRGILSYAYTVQVADLLQGRIVVDLRTQVFEKLQRLSFRFYDANATGSIINRVTGDVQNVRTFVDGVILQGVIMVVSLTVYLIYMLRIDAGLTLACLAITPLIFILSAWFAKTVRPAYRRNRKLVDDLVLKVAETFQGITVIKGFAREKLEMDQFDQSNARVRDQQNWIFRRVSIYTPAMGFLSQMSLVVLLIYGGILVARHELALGAGLWVFSGVLQQFAGQVANISNISNSVQQSFIAANRVFEVLDAPVEIQNPDNPKTPENPSGEVRFEHVYFGYRADEPILEDIHFQVPPGSRVAIVGATGSGKSSLLSLMPRFYDPVKGRILIDGIDIREMQVETLRRMIGLVFQESFLFSSSIAENIAFGHPEASQEAIEAAAKIASAHEFIMAMPEGYKSRLSEGGTNLSGGQRQRLAIARAVLLDPSILILDDPTAAIDSETEREILDAMDSAMKGRTTFVVAHRLSTLRRADFVVVLEHGRILDTGTHAELMQRTGHYREAARLQLAEADAIELLAEEKKTA